MVLIINKTTGRIINDYLLKHGDFNCDQLFGTWKRTDGVVVYPDNCYSVSKWNNEYDFSRDEELPGYTNTYYYIDKQITLQRIIEPDFVKQQIESMKQQLVSTDYMIIKAYEFQLVGLPIPLELTNVHSERQLIRDTINYLENLIY